MAANLDFDFAGWSVGVLNSIDQMRSFGKDSTGKVGLAPVESRINTFYRILGLPATQDPDAKGVDPTNVGNLFTQTDGLTYDDYKVDLANREAMSTTPADTNAQKRVQHFLKGKPSDSLDKRITGHLLPIMVNGGLAVFPKSRRVCVPFQDVDLIQVGDGKTQFARPLIETVVYFRLKGLGVVNSSITSATSSDFSASFDTKIEADVNGVNTAVSNVFMGAILAATDQFSEAVCAASKIAPQIGKTYVLPTGNVAEESPTSATTGVSSGSIDVAQQYQAANQATRQELLTILEYNDGTLGSDKRSMVESVLSSNLVSVISAQEVKTKKDEDNTDRKNQKLTQQVKDVVKTQDLFIGDSSTLSGLDVLVVVAALFEVKLATLLGLLNDEAWQYLTTLQPLVKNSDRSDVQTALDDLTSVVTATYTAIDQELARDVVKHKHSKQK